MISSAQKPAKAARAAAAAFGSRLKGARSSRGLTLRELSESSGLSITYLSDLERGVLQNPTLNALEAIARALKISLNDLLGVDDETSPAPRTPALDEFASSPMFIESINHEAQRRRQDPTLLREAWLDALQRINIQGMRPKQSSDYFFIFEAIRRAIGSA
jgi:transcriptional regulator with XRE-family HTH domain